MVFFGENSLRNAIKEYMTHYHKERNYQGLDHQIIQQGDDVGKCAGEIACCERLNGLLNYYYRKAGILINLSVSSAIVAHALFEIWIERAFILTRYNDSRPRIDLAFVEQNLIFKELIARLFVNLFCRYNHR